MTNIEALIDQIQKLSELEITELVEDIREHCRVNKMEHIFNDPDVNEMEDEINRLTRQLKEYKGNMDRIRHHASEIDDLSIL